jgi:PPK2 family polyphosphate:nucleotide phosphotransferase
MDYREQFFVKPGRKLRLDAIDPAFKGRDQTEEAAAQEMEHHLHRLSHLQVLLSAQRQHSVLIVLQALDAGGKDGTIKHVFAALNPQGVSVTSFKAPTLDELDHDFLWRVHPHVPGKGQIAIFNRSHYEDVLVTRVHNWINKATWRERYVLIRHFEDGLVAVGTRILKFFLYISPEEQLSRFEQRLNDPTRNWKISESDYRERELWPAYMKAYEEMLGQTSTHRSPWYVIPANHKWFRNVAVSHIVAETLEDLHLVFPEPTVDLADIRQKYHQAIELQQQEAARGG